MIWFTADLHLGHENCIKFCNRPFRNIEHMDDRILSSIRHCLAAQDTLIVVGDFSLSRAGAIRAYVDILKAWDINLVLVRGNHDKNALTAWPLIVDSMQMTIANRLTNIHHLPYQFDGRTWWQKLRGADLPRWQHKRVPDDGNWLIHGHTHSPQRLYHKQINVGVDAWDFYPVSIKQIRKIIQRGE